MVLLPTLLWALQWVCGAQIHKAVTLTVNKTGWRIHFTLHQGRELVDYCCIAMYICTQKSVAHPPKLASSCLAKEGQQAPLFLQHSAVLTHWKQRKKLSTLQSPLGFSNGHRQTEHYILLPITCLNAILPHLWRAGKNLNWRLLLSSLILF